MLVTGEVGTGKTMLLRNVIAQVPEHQDVAFILNPKLTVRELLETLCEELGVYVPTDEPMSVKNYIDQLNKHLLKTHSLGRSTVVIIDEAQNLSPAVLEQLRLLTNLETNERKLLRIVLLGQPELSEMLERKELRQLAQRITARYHLRALPRPDTAQYIGHRLSVSGGSAHTFTYAACHMVHRFSGGIPRLINSIADRALLGAYVEGQHRVTAPIVRRAAREVLGRANTAWRWWLVGATSLMLTVGAAWAYLENPSEDELGDAMPAAQPIIRTREATDLAQTNEMPLATQPETPPASLVIAPSPISVPATVEDRASANTQETHEMVIGPRTLGLALPPGQTQYRSLRFAFAAVFEAWGAPFDHSLVPCEQAPDVGLQCLTRMGTLADIANFDRPAVIQLMYAASAEPFYAAVLRRTGDVMHVRVGNEQSTVMLETSAAQSWYGKFTILWQMPPSYHGSLDTDDEGPTVAWVRAALRAATGESISSPNPQRYDEVLESAVIAFQEANGLNPDGIVGPLTWMDLNVASNAPITTLD